MYMHIQRKIYPYEKMFSSNINIFSRTNLKFDMARLASQSVSEKLHQTFTAAHRLKTDGWDKERTR